MDLARLRAVIAAGRYAIDPVAVAEALLRAPGVVVPASPPGPTTR